MVLKKRPLKTLSINVSQKVFDDLMILARYHGNKDGDLDARVNLTAEILFEKVVTREKIDEFTVIARRHFLERENKKMRGSR